MEEFRLAQRDARELDLDRSPGRPTISGGTSAKSGIGCRGVEAARAEDEVVPLEAPLAREAEAHGVGPALGADVAVAAAAGVGATLVLSLPGAAS